jgi:ribonuclease R
MSMPRAKYSTNNLGHFALALLAYLHYTSPIRRLPDLCVHMVIDIVLENFEKISQMNLDELTDWLEKLAQHASKMERNADMAEYESEKRAILEAMEKSDTDELEATVIEINKKIRIKIMGIDTFISEANLSNNIAFDNSKKLYYDKNNYEYIAVGSKLIVTKTNINLTNRTFSVYVQGVKSSHIKKKVK